MMLIGEADFQKIPKIFDTLPLHTSPSSFLLLPLLLPLLPPQKEEEEVYMGTQKNQKIQKFGQIPKWEFRKSLTMMGRASAAGGLPLTGERGCPE